MAGGAGFAVRELRKLAGAPARGSFFANLSIESGVSGFRALATKATRGKNAKTPVANVPQVKAEGTKKKRVYKGRNLIEVAQFLPGWGVGAKMTKSHWRPNTYYQITDIKLNKVVLLPSWSFRVFSSFQSCLTNISLNRTAATVQLGACITMKASSCRCL